MDNQSFDLSAIQYHQTVPFEQERSLFCNQHRNTIGQVKKISQTENVQTNCEPKPESIFQGSFLKALSRYQKDISYESDVYDIYQKQRKDNDYLFYQNIMKKSQSTLKYTIDFKKKKGNHKNQSKSKSKSKNSKIKSTIKEAKSPVNLKLSKNLNQYFAGSTLTSPKSTQRNRLKSTISSQSKTKNRQKNLKSIIKKGQGLRKTNLLKSPKSKIF